MTISDQATRAAIEQLRAAAAVLADSDDELVRTFAVRVDALTRSLIDSVLVDLLPEPPRR